MVTLFNDIYDLFFKRVLEDSDFFSYTNVPEIEVVTLIEARAFDYMIESISTILEYSAPEVDFNGYDTTTEEFDFEMTKSELQMLVNLMFEKFLSRDQAKLKIYNKFFTTNEINMFSPAQDRKTFVEMLSNIENKNIRAVKSYGSRDRITNALKSYSGVTI